ncbi:TNF receptor-associated factor 2-like [Mercenaria mercenaria]|uniref:TNF receptor-associated factor 2-like n=1 Tax=Mercenaria mercenaria TaxID=6596 RepID=UPI00234FAAA3|nr:TNF receptor-associated factor 2-like [Mercenaria mercenaria]
MQQYYCLICGRLLKRPVQTKNGHRFCKGCFFKRRTGRQRCILCVEDEVPEEQDCFNLGIEFIYGDKAVVYDIYKLEAQCRECGCVANYREIMKNHIKNPCQGRNCSYIYQIFNKLTSMILNLQCSICSPPHDRNIQ